MDYDAYLVQSCPPVYVTQARSEDWTNPERPYVIEDAWTDRSMTQECLNALLAYFVPKVGPDSDSAHLEIWLEYIPAYRGPMEEGFRQDLIDAIMRIPYGSVDPESYYRALAALRLDIRDHLSQIVDVNWDFNGLDEPHADTWYYTFYLASFDTPGAYAALDKKVATTKSGDEVFRYLNSLLSFGTDKAFEIVNKYADDQRLVHSRSTGQKFKLGPRIKSMVESKLKYRHD